MRTIILTEGQVANLLEAIQVAVSDGVDREWNARLNVIASEIRGEKIAKLGIEVPELRSKASAVRVVKKVSEALSELSSLVETLNDEANAYMDNRSDSWQESEAAEWWEDLCGDLETWIETLLDAEEATPDTDG